MSEKTVCKRIQREKCLQRLCAPLRLNIIVSDFIYTVTNCEHYIKLPEL